MKQLLFIAAALFTLSSCQKKDDTAPDPSKVVISINNPTEGQTFHRGDTVFLKAVVNYVSELHGYDLSLVRTSDQAVLFEDEQHVHADNFTVDEYWVDTLSQSAGLTLKLTAEIDHDGHEATKTISLNSLP